MEWEVLLRAHLGPTICQGPENSPVSVCFIPIGFSPALAYKQALISVLLKNRQKKV